MITGDLPGVSGLVCCWVDGEAGRTAELEGDGREVLGGGSGYDTRHTATT